MVMKRGSDIDSPRSNKRTRGGLEILHTVNIDRFSSEGDRRARALSPETRTFYRKSERASHVSTIRSEFGVDSLKGKRTERDDEASIRVTNFNRGAADHILRDKLNYEFKKFGEITVRIMRHDDERCAVVYFRNSDDAIEAKRSIENRGRAIFLQDRALKLQFTIPGTASRSSRRFTPDVLHQKSRFSRDSLPRSKLQRDVLDIANVEENYERRNRKGDRFFSGQDSAITAALAEEEDDPKATRTLFVGNLESSISRQDVRREFEQFGIVEDVDIKRPIRGLGSTYAFVKFIDLDVATKAKVAMQGSFFGRNRVKIGYGKSMPTTRLWIGGLGSWTSLVELEREFDRFGAIRRIDYNKGHDHAFILYDSLDAASVAAREMRGFKMNGRRLKIDFADLTQGLEEYPDTLGHLAEDRENQFTSPQIQDKISSTEKKVVTRERNNSDGSGKWSDSVSNHSFNDAKQSGGKHDSWQWVDEKEAKQKLEERPKIRGPRTPSPPFENQNTPSSNHRREKSREKHKSSKRVSHSRSPSAKRPRKPSGPAPALSPQRFGSISPKRKSRSSSPATERNHKGDKYRREKDQEKDKNKGQERKESPQKNKSVGYEKPASESKEIVPVEEPVSGVSESLQDIAKRFAVAWRGSLILKNSSFPVRLHLIGGNPEIVEVLLRNLPGNSAPNTVLRISQRLRLDQPKLEEVSKRMNSAGASGYCMLLALPGVHGGEPPLDTETSMPTQQRPLRNLVTYLKQKQAAGVVNLMNANSLSPTNIKDEGGVLHAFPPCQYSHDQLLKIAPHLGQEAFNEDHLVVVVIRGPA